MFTEEFAVAADGARLRYGVEGSGPTRVALTHSLAMTSEFWRPLVDRLEDKFSVLTWDCRGHGASDKPAGPYSAEQFGDDLAAVFDAAGWDKAICAGASMGGTVTIAFAAAYPEKVAALGLFDTTASYGAGAPEAWEERATKAQSEGLASLTAFQKTRWFSDAFREANAALVERCVDIFCQNDIDAYQETCRMLGSADLVATLDKIAVPTTILVGEEDYATPPPMAEAMHQRIAGSTLEVIPAARHLTPLECPALIADRLSLLAQKVAA